jgi:hypothetical protein
LSVTRPEAIEQAQFAQQLIDDGKGGPLTGVPIALNVGDLEFTDEGLILHIRKSKTDQEGKGVHRGVEHSEDGSVCGPCAVYRWLEGAPALSGPLFRGLQGQRVVPARIQPAKVAESGLPDLGNFWKECKELADARTIRLRILRNVAAATMPDVTPEQVRALLSFVIVGGGPERQGQQRRAGGSDRQRQREPRQAPPAAGPAAAQHRRRRREARREAGRTRSLRSCPQFASRGQRTGSLGPCSSSLAS